MKPRQTGLEVDWLVALVGHCYERQTIVTWGHAWSYHRPLGGHHSAEDARVTEKYPLRL